MTYTYRFLDVEEEYADVEQGMSDPILSEIDGRPVRRVITGGSGTVFRGVWNDNAAQYSRVREHADGRREYLGDGSS